MAVIHVHGADLMMFSRVETQLAPLGHSVQRARAGLPGAAPDVCICDVERVEPVAAVASLRPAKLLGFGSHEQPEALRAARRAGFDRVVARSAIAERLAALVDELMI
jgi:DNA-binding NarL/FixJ family response regulator